jgi:formylglycine-generating enzyme required for sulfatase activity
MKKTIGAAFLLTTATVSVAQDANKEFKPYKQSIPGSSYEMAMVPIPAGSFLMGSPATEKNRKPDEGPQQKVKISAFWMASLELSRDIFDVYFKMPTQVRTPKWMPLHVPVPSISISPGAWARKADFR